MDGGCWVGGSVHPKTHAACGRSPCPSTHAGSGGCHLEGTGGEALGPGPELGTKPRGWGWWRAAKRGAKRPGGERRGGRPGATGGKGAGGLAGEARLQPAKINKGEPGRKLG